MNKRVVCIGAALVDELFYTYDEIMRATTNMAEVERTAGGVARNLAQQLVLLNIPVSLIVAFGDDAEGEWLAQNCRHAGIDISASVFGKNCSTGKYTGIVSPDGSLYTALLSNDCNKLVDPAHLALHQSVLLDAAFIVAETNLSIASMQWLTSFSRQYNIPLIIETVSVPPAKKLKQIDLSGVFLIAPNEDELPALMNDSHTTHDSQARALIARGVQNVWLHEGANGSKLFTKENIIHIKARKVHVKDSTGAGDGSLAGFIWGLCQDRTLVESIRSGHWLASEILQVRGSIAHHVTHEQLLNVQLDLNE